MSGSSDEFIGPNGDKGVHVITNDGGGVQFWYQNNYVIVLPSTNYMYSAIVKFKNTPSTNLLYNYQYDINGQYVTEFGLYSSSRQIDLGNGWYKVYGILTTSSNTHTIIPYGFEYNPNEIWIYDVQIELGNYFTSYINGTRLGNGTVQIPTEIGLSDFTLVGEFVPDVNSDTIPDGSYFLQIGNTIRIATYAPVGFLPFLNGDEIVGSGGHNVHIDFNSIPGNKIIYIITRQGQTLNWRMISSDGQDKTWSITDININTTMVIDNIHLNYTWPGIHKNISIYNKVLNDNEIKKILNNTFSIYKNGDINSFQLVEDYDLTIPMKILKNKIIVQNKIIEGEIL